MPPLFRHLPAALLLAAALTAAPTAARAGDCQSCTTAADCNAGVCVEWIGAPACSTAPRSCCPGQGCALMNGVPSCVATGRCRVATGGGLVPDGGSGVPRPDDGGAPPGDAARPITDAAADDVPAPSDAATDDVPAGDGGGTSTTSSSNGCGCRVDARASDGRASVLALGLAAALTLLRRARRRR